MKKLFACILATGLAGFVYAQPGGYYPSRTPRPPATFRTMAPVKSYKFTQGKKDRTIARIHRKYERKIREVTHRLFMSRFKKMETVRHLERERDIEIGRVNARFYNNHNRAYYSGNYNRRRY